MGHLEEEEDLFSPFNQHLVIKFKAKMGFRGASNIGRKFTWTKSRIGQSILIRVFLESNLCWYQLFFYSQLLCFCVFKMNGKESAGWLWTQDSHSCAPKLNHSVNQILPIAKALHHRTTINWHLKRFLPSTWTYLQGSFISYLSNSTKCFSTKFFGAKILFNGFDGLSRGQSELRLRFSTKNPILKNSGVSFYSIALASWLKTFRCSIKINQD